MNVIANTSTPTVGLAPRTTSIAHGITSRQSDFAGILGKAAKDSTSTPENARKAAEEFVAMSLVQPLLAQLRSSNNTAAPFAPSSGETQFQQMLDAQVSQNIVRAKQFPLVESVARKLLSASRTDPAAPSADDVVGPTSILNERPSAPGQDARRARPTTIDPPRSGP